MAGNQPKFSRVEPDHESWVFLDQLVAAHHPHLSEAKIALVWAHALKPDKDGHLVWGQVKKVQPLDQQFHEHDFIILLNQTAYDALPPESRRALLDHELCHCGAQTNDEGEVSYYCRKHDLEEFTSIVRRYGLWRSAVEQLVNAVLERQRAAQRDEAADAAPDAESE